MRGSTRMFQEADLVVRDKKVIKNRYGGVNHYISLPDGEYKLVKLEEKKNDEA